MIKRIIHKMKHRRFCKLLFFSGDGNGWLDWLKQEADDATD